MIHHSSLLIALVVLVAIVHEDIDAARLDHQTLLHRGSRGINAASDIASDTTTATMVATGTGAPTPEEMSSLMDLWNITSRSSAGWTQSRGWKRWDIATICAPSPSISWFGITCDHNGHIQKLILNANNLAGYIPSSIGQLKWLTHVDFSWNALNTSLDVYCLLPSLQSLSLDSLGMVGSIPSCMASLPLSVFSVQLNHLTGPFPSFFNQLVNLTVINIGTNALEGPLPDLSALIRMQTLNIADNMGLNGSIPDYICTWRDMTSFTASDCDISGSLPLCLASLPSLRSFWVPRMKLSGSLPPLPSQLQVLNVEQNHMLTGTLVSLNNLTQLEWVRCSDNHFTGEWPLYANLSRLRFLDISSNSMHGVLPNKIILPSLTELDISNNAFIGDMSSLGQLGNLQRANLANNRFTNGTNANLPKLEILIMDNNDLSFTFDESKPCPPMILAPKLQVLSLDSTGLSGSLYQAFKCISILFTETNTLNLARNQLQLLQSDGAACDGTTSSLLRFLINLDVSWNHITSFRALYDLFIPHMFQFGDCTYFVASTILQTLDTRGNPGLHADHFDMGAFRRNMKTSFLDDMTNLTCPTRGLNLGQTGLTMFYDPSSFGYDTCRCPSDLHYYWNGAIQRCLPCPNGCLCISNLVALLDPLTNVLSVHPRAIVVRHDWYPLCDGRVCTTINRYPEPTVIECYVPGLCAPHVDDTSSHAFICAEGHDPTSMMCSRCLAGWYSIDGHCTTCPTGASGIITALTIVGLMMLILVISQYEYEDGSSAMPQLVVFWLQLSAILNEDLGGRSRVDANRGIGHIVASIFGLQNIANIDISMMACTLDYESRSSSSSSSTDDTSIDEPNQFAMVLYAKMILFVAMYTFIGMIAIIRWFVARRRLSMYAMGNGSGELGDRLVADVHVPVDGQALLNRIPSAIQDIVPRFVSRVEMACYFVLDFVFFPLAAGVLHVLRCDDLRDIAPWPIAHFLRAAPYISCTANTGFHQLRTASIIVFIGLIIHPLHVLIRLWRVRPILGSHPLRHSIGFLVSSSSARHYWWSLVVVPGRRLLLALIVSQLPRGSILIPLSIFALLLFCVILQVFVRPYERVHENIIEVALLTLALFSYAASVFLAGSVDISMDDANYVNDVLALLNVCVKYTLMIVLVITYAPKVKRMYVKIRTRYSSPSS